jgi:hypothetical protein
VENGERLEKDDVAGNRLAGGLLGVSIQKELGRNPGGAKAQFNEIAERL